MTGASWLEKNYYLKLVCSSTLLGALQNTFGLLLFLWTLSELYDTLAIWPQKIAPFDPIRISWSTPCT